jgi:hypothetical protein
MKYPICEILFVVGVMLFLYVNNHNFKKKIRKKLRGRHVCTNSSTFGDWRIDGTPCELHLKQIRDHLTKDKLRLIKFSDIGFKGRQIDYVINPVRYRKSDVSYPGILSNMPNPYNLPYRMIDGVHRINKMINQGFTESYFYVLPEDVIRNNLTGV